MSTYIALLRGINVSGQKPVRMEDLKKIFESLGFADVRTYIQSGNVVFAAGKKGDAALARSIEKKIEEKYSFEVPVIIRSVEEVEKILAANPFRKVKLKPEERIYVTLLEETPAKDKVKQLDKYAGREDEFKIAGAEVYLLPRGSGYGKTLFSNAFFEKALGVKATTRNTATLEKLAAMGEAP